MSTDSIICYLASRNTNSLLSDKSPTVPNSDFTTIASMQLYVLSWIGQMARAQFVFGRKAMTPLGAAVNGLVDVMLR